MEDLEYIKQFSKITIKDLCKKKNIDASNLWSGRTSKKNIKLIRRCLESEVAKLYLLKEEDEVDKANNTLQPRQY